MCVGLPARVVQIQDGTALVDAGGARREVSAELLDELDQLKADGARLRELDPGDYVMVHAGIAIAKITGDDSAETDALLAELE